MQASELYVLLEALKQHARVAVIYAGDPQDPNSVLYQTHNTRSWKSYRQVAQDIANALRRLGFKSVYVVPEDVNLHRALLSRDINFAWLNTGGLQGFDPASHCAGILQSLGIPYVGHTPLNAASMDDKLAFKRFLKSEGIRTAPFAVWQPTKHADSAGQVEFAQLLSDIVPWDDVKFVVKPVCGRASQNIYVAEYVTDVISLCQTVFAETGNRVLVEQYLPGKEYCIAVMGEWLGAHRPPNKFGVGHRIPTCFGHFERVLGTGEEIFTSMDIKPISDESIRSLDVEHDWELVSELHSVARHIFQKLDLYNLIRVDLRKDASGRLHVLEANPKPDLKAPEDKVTSLVAMGLDHLGVPYDVLIEQMLLQTLRYLNSIDLVSGQLQRITHGRSLNHQARRYLW